MAVMLSTTDNPYNPFTQFTEWKAYDESQGYYTCEYLARIATSSDSLSSAEQEVAMADAIEEILALNVLGIYTKVFDSEEDEKIQIPIEM